MSRRRYLALAVAVALSPVRAHPQDATTDGASPLTRAQVDSFFGGDSVDVSVTLRRTKVVVGDTLEIRIVARNPRDSAVRILPAWEDSVGADACKDQIVGRQRARSARAAAECAALELRIDAHDSAVVTVRRRAAERGDQVLNVAWYGVVGLSAVSTTYTVAPKPPSGMGGYTCVSTTRYRDGTTESFEYECSFFERYPVPNLPPLRYALF